MTGNKRQCCFRKGKFFVILDSGHKGGRWIALGPDRKVTIPFSILLLLSGILENYIFRFCESSVLAYIMLVSYILTLVSYFYTSLLDPGIIQASEDNSIENKNTLEPLGYTYCSICGLYRPPNGYHCTECSVCFYNHDHHCTFMGQCVAKNNLISFYLFIASLLVYLISLEVGAMTIFATKPEGIVRDINTLWLYLSMLMNSQHLRKDKSFVCSMKSINHIHKLTCKM